MTRQSSICTYISRISISLLLLLATVSTQAQGFLKLQRDTVPFFRGFAVSADLVGLVQMQVSDYGQYEGALRINLHDQYFPVLELGVGRANHDYDEVTDLSYKTSAPYFRIGADVNIAKNKHAHNRIYAGVRYGYTNYKVDIDCLPFKDPVWKTNSYFRIDGQQCSQHWAEVLFGLDAEIAGPLHLGWMVRYRTRLAHDEGNIGNTWYVPGYGKQDTSNLGFSFNFILDI